MDEDDTSKSFYFRMVLTRGTETHIGREESIIFEIMVVSFLANLVLAIFGGIKLNNLK